MVIKGLKAERGRGEPNRITDSQTSFASGQLIAIDGLSWPARRLCEQHDVSRRTLQFATAVCGAC